jgi:Chaperone of endosialidase
MGYEAEALGISSIAIGAWPRASGSHATAMGTSNVAKGYSSFVIGMHNDSIFTQDEILNASPMTPLFIIGNGSQVNIRSNAMVVLKNGNVAIGNNPTPVNPLHITDGTNLSLADNSGYMTLGATNSSNMVFDNNEIQVRNNGVGTNLYLQTNGGKVIIGSGAASVHLFTVNGSAYKNDGSNVWQTSSDARLKKDIEPYSDGLTSILKIQPVWFRYNKTSGFDMEQKKVGILAQDLQKISPYMVSASSAIKAPDGTSYLSVDNGAMTYMLINAVKELKQEIEALKKQIAERK